MKALAVTFALSLAIAWAAAELVAKPLEAGYAAIFAPIVQALSR